MGRMLRPKATVLPESAMVPEANLRSPADRYTHEVVVEQPYFFSAINAGQSPDGTFAAGTKVLLLAHEQGALCLVVDDRGLRVSTAFEGLRTLQQR